VPTLQRLLSGAQQKARRGAGVGKVAQGSLVQTVSGAKAGGLDQTHLVATGCEFATLIALHHNATTRFDADHPGTNPAEGCGFENLDHITGL